MTINNNNNNNNEKKYVTIGSKSNIFVDKSFCMYNVNSGTTSTLFVKNSFTFFFFLSEKEERRQRGEKYWRESNGEKKRRGKNHNERVNSGTISTLSPKNHTISYRYYC